MHITALYFSVEHNQHGPNERWTETERGGAGSRFSFASLFDMEYYYLCVYVCRLTCVWMGLIHVDISGPNKVHAEYYGTDVPGETLRMKYL